MKVQDTEILRRSSVFRFLADEHFAAIEPLLEGEHYEFGDVIVKQDDPADAFYVLTRGRARALKIKPGGERIPLGVLKPGDSFEEAALSEGGARNAMVRCSTAVDVLRLDRDDFTELVRRVPDLKQYVETTGQDRALQSFLYQFSNFGRLPTPVLRGMIDRLKPVTIEKGDLIIREGDDAGPLYILQKGRARAFAGVDGQTRNLAFYREGDFFGELSVLNGSPRAASVEAFTDCQLLSLEPKSVQDLRRRFPEFDKLLSERLALYQAKTEARISLDFTTELLPAETHVQNKVELDGQQPPADGEDKEEPFADERGWFRKLPRREFEAKWTGYAALFDYTPAFEQAPESKPTLAWFLPFVARFKVILLQVMGLAVAVSVLQLLFPVFTQMVVDKVIVENDVGLLKTILLGLLAAIVFVQLSTLAQEYLLAFAAVRLDTTVLDFLSRKLLSLPMTYFTSRRTGDIQRRLDGARQVRQFAVQQGVGALLAAVFLVGAVILMAMYSPLLTLAFLATTPIYVGLMLFSVKVLRSLYHGVE